MQQSDSINELASALSKAQSEIEGAVKDSTNPFFKSAYADIQSVIQAIKVPLAKHGLSISQLTDYEDGKTIVETQIMHSSGQWMRGRYPVYAKDDSPQAQGSGLSYAKRYALQSALCVSAVDDDGNAAQSRPTNREMEAAKAAIETAKTITSTNKVVPVEARSASLPMTQKQYDWLSGSTSGRGIIQNSHWTHDDLARYCATRYKVTHPKDVAFKDFEGLKNYIENNPKLGQK